MHPCLVPALLFLRFIRAKNTKKRKIVTKVGLLWRICFRLFCGFCSFDEKSHEESVLVFAVVGNCGVVRFVRGGELRLKGFGKYDLG